MGKTKTDNSYEELYWKEVEENIQLNEEIEKLLEIKNICK